jgi:opacity protein-like surface antigen
MNSKGLYIMRLRKLIKSSLTCATLMAAIVANAEQDLNLPETFGYVQLNGGPAFNLTGAGMFGNKNAGNTGVYGIEAGYKFDDYTRASISLDYMPGNNFDSSANENDSGNVGSSSYVETSNNNFKVDSWILMFNGYYDIKNSSDFTPYFTLGAGVAHNKAKSTYTASTSINGGGFESDSADLGEATKDNFAYKIGLGTRYSINKSFDLDLRYQFVDLGKVTTASGSYNSSGTVIPVSEQTVKLKSQQVLLGIAYKF